jgi:hypothetical protein
MLAAHRGAGDYCFGFVVVAMTQYVLIKRDLFDCPKHMGYTGIRDKAGVYDEEYIKGYEVPIRSEYDWQEEDLYALPLTAAPEFTKACFHDLARGHLIAKIHGLREENAKMREAVRVWADSMRAEGLNKAPPLEWQVAE